MTEATQVNATTTPAVPPPATAPATPPVNPVPEVTPQAAAEPAKETPPEQDPKFAAKFAALSRREQEVRAKVAEMKAKEAEFKAWQEQTKLAEENPLKYLEARGWTFDKLTQLALNDGKKPAEMRIQELEAKLEKEAKEREEKAQKAAEQDVETKRKAFLDNAKGFLNQNKEKYELTANEEEGPELLHNVMWAAFEKDGTRMTLEQAADTVEKYFEDIIDQKYAKLSKVQAKFKPKETPPAAAPVPGKPAQQTATLTNTQAASVPTPATAQALSIDESKQLAAKLLRWT